MNLLRKKTSIYNAPQQLQESGNYPYFKPIESAQDTVVQVAGKKVMMFGSNSYLGLTNHPVIKEAAIAAIQKYGTGCAGSRFLNGTIDLHLQLEELLADFVGKEAAIVFSTGFQANLGTISSLLGRNDTILIDDQVHASIIDGCRLSFANTVKYRHNDMASLDKELKNTNGNSIKLIVVDGVFSMEGDIAKLPEIAKLAESYGASIMVDEAHSLGVMGKNGSGSVSHFNLNNQVDLIMGTFSKSLASIGGFIASDTATINYLKHNARSLIFSASISPANAASAMAAVKIIKAEPERIEKLWENTRLAKKLFHEIGFDTGNSETPIIPVYVRDDLKTFVFTRTLLEQGVFVNAVVSPAVKSDSSLIRFSLMATHTPEQIETAIEKMGVIAKNLGILPEKALIL